MKKTILGILAFASLNAFAQNTYSVDNSESKVAWHAEKVPGSHDGTINIKSGSLEANNGALTGGNFVIDMTSIVVTDLEGEWKTKLENHLNSDDFFSVEKFKTAKFVITEVKSKGKNQYTVTGDMTIKGITNKQSFDATIKVSGEDLNAEAEIVIDRAKYNVRYGSDSFFDNLGDKTIYDEFTLKVNLSAEADKS